MSIFLIDRTEVKTHQVINILLPLILFLASISLGKESYRNFFNIVSFFYSFVILSFLNGNYLSVYIHSDTDTSGMLIMSPNSFILLLLVCPWAVTLCVILVMSNFTSYVLIICLWSIKNHNFYIAFVHFYLLSMWVIFIPFSFFCYAF